MIRALSTRRNRGGYERLGDETGIEPLDGKLKRATSVPAKLHSPLGKLGPESTSREASSQVKPAKKAGKSSHPLLSFFNVRSQKKVTSKPEFSRYLEYVKEGGTWDTSSNMPVIYHK